MKTVIEMNRDDLIACVKETLNPFSGGMYPRLR
jgi:hypothetical protein